MRTLSLLLAVAAVARGQDVNDKTEAALKDAAAKVAPCVVKIETAGGAEVVGGPNVLKGGVRKGTGPTTGLIVSADGYVVTSSFNFVNKPSDIFVTIPGRPGRLVAKQVATDQTRLLTLVKVDATGLPVPAAVPRAEIAVGQWAMALGRTLSALTPDAQDPPSVSLGIVSATDRMIGKAIQTDAKVSPVNYGGPLVALDGRVQGVLIPASPRGEGDTSGVEWYDSGIGYAVPLDDVFAALPRLKGGKDLRRGQLGVTLSNPTDLYTLPVVVATVSPESAAQKAGIKPNDTISKIDGKPVANYAQLQYALGPKYDGDVVSVVVTREGKEVEFKTVTLTAIVASYVNPYLGLLPMRDDPEPGVEVRHVFPGSPAEKAGVKPGDRVMKVGVVPPAGTPAPPMATVPGQGKSFLSAFVGRLAPESSVKLELKRKDGGKTETVTAKLGTIPDTLTDVAPPLPSSAGKALDKPKGAKADDGEKKDEPKKVEDKKDDDDKKEPEFGLLKRRNATLGREYSLYVPPTYKPSVAHGLIIWLHPAGKGGKDAEELAKIWKPFLDEYHYLLVCPKAAGAEWVASETEGVVQDVKEVMSQYTIDRQRVVAHGLAAGGQMAFYIGFNARDVVRGVAVSGAALGTQPKDNVPNQPLSFFIVGGDKDPAIKEIEASKPALLEKKFPVVYKRLPEFGKEYIDQKSLLELCVWIETLDKF